MRALPVAAAMACLLGAASGTVCAQASDGALEPIPDDVDAEARVHFQAGTNYFQVGDYVSAIREYERSYALSQRPELLYNLFMCRERLGQLEEAIQTLDRFLAERPDIAEREVLEARLDHLRERLDAERAAAVVEPEPEAPSVADSVVEPAPPPEAPPGGGLSTPATVTLVVGGGLALGWGAAAVSAFLIDQDLATRCGTTCPTSETDALFGASVAADILLGVSAATLILGVVLAFTTEGDAEPTIAVEPRVGGDAAGLTVRGTFF